MGHIIAFILGSWFGVFIMAIMNVAKSETNKEQNTNG